MTTPTTTPPAPEQPQAPTPQGALTPVQPARVLDSSANYTTGAPADDKGKQAPQAAHGGSVSRALLLALAERWRQRPVTQQKRWEARKAKALGHQVKETRSVNRTPAPVRKDTPGKSTKQAPTGGRQTPPRQPTAAGNKPPPKPPTKGSGTVRNDGRKESGNDRKPDGNRKAPDRKSPAPKPIGRTDTRKDSGSIPTPRKPVQNTPNPRKASPESRTGKPEAPRKTPEKPRSAAGMDRKDIRKPVRNTGAQPDSGRKSPEKPRNDRKPQPNSPRKNSGGDWKSPERIRKDPNSTRKAPEKSPVRTPDSRKEQGPRKSPEIPSRKVPGPRPDAPRTPERKTSSGTPIGVQGPVRQKPPVKGLDKQQATHPGAVKQSAKPDPDQTPTVPQVSAQPLTKKEDPVATTEKTVTQPVEAKGVNAWGVQLGTGSTRSTLSRGEVATMKQLERYLGACVTQMEKAAEQTKRIRDMAVEEATEAQKLAERTRSVKGGERLLPKLNRLAEQADNRAKKAEGIHKGDLQAVDRGKALLSNLKQRDGLIYQAVLDSPETEPAEMAFYQKGN